MKTKNKKPMNCKEANEIRIVQFLFDRGVNLERSSGGDFWYCSPLRHEEKASFKVNSNKNVWFDYGTGTGGKLIDLVCAINRVDVPGALLILSGVSPSSESIKFDLSFDRQNCPIAGIKINHIQPLQTAALIQYLEQRKIPFTLAGPHLKEAYYTAKNKKYFAIAFKNDLGGYELRNKYYKGGNSPKGITTIKGSTETNTVNIFEGFMDYLSALVYNNAYRPKCDTIILNSISHLGKVYNLLAEYKHINLYLDNDKAGKDTAKRIQDKRPEAVNRSEKIYPGYKDFNEYLILK